VSKVVLLGATGFLGRHTLPILEDRYGKENVVGLSSKDYDLMNFNECRKMFEEHRPNVIVHFAAYSGGIGANRTYPADFYHINILLQANVFKLASEYGVQKMVYAMGGCSYPATATSPIDESQMWCGYPQAESAGYSTAKMMGIVASKSYRSQYGLKTSVIIPGNMYGEYDNFICGDSHVVPAMLRRYYEAKMNGLDEVVMWGSGNPQRDFVYAGDVAKTIPYFIDEYDSDEIVNISSGTTTAIRELAETIKEFTGYKGEIKWDTEKPDGQMVKIFDTTKMKSLGLSCDTKLLDGIKVTASWLEKNYTSKTDGIRL
jgi:GDP-L-fucose synthase